MNKFAYLIHPLEVQDLYKEFPLSKKISKIFIEELSTRIFPFKVFQINKIQTSKGEVEGYFILLPFTTKKILELPQEKLLKKLLKACKMAEDLGANMIGLGGMLSNIENIDSILSKKCSIPITTGYTCRVVTVIDGVRKETKKLKKEFKDCEILVIGQNSSISDKIIKYIASEARYLTWVSNNKEKSEVLFNQILQETGTVIHISKELDSAIKRADILFITDSMNSKCLEFVKEGAFICNLSGDRSIIIELKKTREDLFFVDDAILTFPGFHRWNASITETIILTLEEAWECFSLERKLEIEKMNKIKQWIKENNIQLTEVCNLDGNDGNFYYENANFLDN